MCPSLHRSPAIEHRRQRSHRFVPLPLYCSDPFRQRERFFRTRLVRESLCGRREPQRAATLFRRLGVGCRFPDRRWDRRESPLLRLQRCPTVQKRDRPLAVMRSRRETVTSPRLPITTTRPWALAIYLLNARQTGGGHRSAVAQRFRLRLPCELVGPTSQISKGRR
jgi:hypothetical protein